MPARKASTNPPKKSKWIKKGWVIKKVRNPVVCCNMSSYPPMKCKVCGFYPVYADAYGTYRCPRCGSKPDYAGVHARALTGPGPAKTCPFCQWYPCYFDIAYGTYRCPKCGKAF